MTPDACRAAETYDAVPYPGAAYPETHPDRLATIATLFGLSPASPEQCRVLELGCGDGANLIPMALTLPRSRFVGLDVSQRAIRTARSHIAALGLDNIEVRGLDLCDYDPAPGSFDYLIAHGLYSWVPQTVRESILRLARRCLAPQGVAYVSYNTYPGGYLRRMLREMMLYHAGRIADPQQRIARAREALAGLAQALVGDDPYRSFLTAEIARLRTRPDAHLYHDELAEIYEPVSFEEFMAHARRHGLQYLGEANYFDMQIPPLPVAARALLEEVAGDAIRKEQYLDFMRCRCFRRTLLCHQEISVDRAVAPERLANLYVSSFFAPTEPPVDVASDAAEEFGSPRGRKLLTAHPISKAALVELALLWPAAIHFPELLERVRARGVVADAHALGQMLLQAYGAAVIELHVCPPRLAPFPGPRPRASEWARRQADSQAEVTTLRHTTVRLEGPLERRLLVLLDGTRDRDALVKELDLPGAAAQEFEQALARLGRLGLLMC